MEYYCDCHQGRAPFGAPSEPQALLASASVADVSYSTAHDSPAKVEDCRDRAGSNTEKHEKSDNHVLTLQDQNTDAAPNKTYSGGGILSGSTSLRNSLLRACSAAQRLLGSKFSMWSKRSRAEGGMLNENKNTRAHPNETKGGQLSES